MHTIDSIIKACGGVEAIQKHIAKMSRDPKAITTWAIHKWRSNGIPDRHWPALMDMAKLTPADMYEANRRAREAA